MISPSRIPKERIVPSVISPKMVSSILSLSKDAAYRVQSSISQPADKKKSNQSILGAFLGDGALERALVEVPLDIASGISSSETRGTLVERFPLSKDRSTYRISSTDIFSEGTSTMTPLTLCKRSFPLLKPKKAASTRN